MPSTRIFVGGLSDKVDRQDLGGKLSRYAPVLSIDLKEKTDPEGNVLLRFAYVNIDAAPSQVEECIQHLHGASWKGSHLRVERAKESFLDRLNRERATKKQEQEKTYYEKSNNLAVNNQRLSATDTEDGLGHYKGHRVVPEEKTSGINDIKHSKKRKECNIQEENGVTPRKNKSLDTSDDILKTDSYSHSTRKEKKKKKNEVEEEILSSFKQFSSVWADSDNENDEEGTGFQDSHDESHKGQGGSIAVKPDKLAGHKSHRGTQNTKDKISHRVDQNEDTDDTVDENYDNSIGSYADVRKEQQTQLEILDSLDDPHRYVSRGKGVTDEQVMKDNEASPDNQQYQVQAAADKTAMGETMPSEPEAKSKYVKVSKDLTFGQNTSGFSLLAQFSKINKEAVASEVEKEEVVAAPVSVPRSLVTVHQKVKTRPFFISGNDPEIKAAIEWMTQPITEAIIKEFEETLPDLRQVIKTRSFRAKKEAADPRMQRRGRGRGRGRGQSRGQGRRMAAGDDTENPYRDHRWRERDIKK